MSFIFKALAASALASAIVATPAAATVTINFSFTGASSHAGTVTGQLTFANAGTNVAATSVKVFSATNAAFIAPFDAMVGNTIYSNKFTVTAAGDVTATNFSSSAIVSNGTRALDLGSEVYNNLQLSYSAGGFTSITGAPSGATYTLVPNIAAVPEPATWGMMIAGFGMVGGIMRYRKRSPKVAFA